MAIVVVAVIVAAAAIGGGYMVMSGGDSDTPEDGGTDLTGTVTYSGTWSGSITGVGDVTGTWEFEADFDSGTVSGWFKGDGAGDISGSVSDGVIEASGSAAFGTVDWSGSFSSDGSSISGDWELEGGAGSGTWEGSEGEADTDTDTDNDTDTDTGGDTNTWTAYEYKEGETYEYSILAEDMEGTFSWKVDSVTDDGKVTVTVEYDVGGFQGDKTWTGLMATAHLDAPDVIAPYLNTTIGMTWSNYVGGSDLSVGNSWSFTNSEGDTMTFEVTKTKTYAGQESYVTEVTSNDDLAFKFAISPDLALPTYVALYDEGNIAYEIELQNYSG